MKSIFLHDLKVACRSLLKYKLQTVISVVGLAVGLTCFVVCNTGLRDALMKNRRLADAENIYILTPKEHSSYGGVRIDQKFAKEVKDKFPEIKTFVSFIGDIRTSKKCVVEYEGGKRLQEKDFLYSDSSFMDFFDFKLLQGNLDVVKSQPDAVILTESAAIRLFGTTDVVGKTFIDVDDWSSIEKECKIAGVMADFPLQTDIEHNAGVVLNTTDKYIKRIWPFAVRTYFRIHENIPIEDLNKKIEIYLEKRFGTEDRLSSLNFDSISRLSSYYLTSSLAMSGIGLLVLLTAIFNYVMFMSGRILNRQKEYGVRQITGASSNSIFRMFAMEITLSIGVVILLSLILIELLTRVFSGESSYYISFDDRQNWVFILGGYLLEYALLVWLVMLGICWSVLKRFRTQTTLQHIQGGGVRYKNRLSNLLLGLQLTICMFLSGGAYFLYTQQDFVMEKFQGKISIETCKRIYGFYLYGEKLQSIKADFQNMINANPYIESSCWSYNRLLSPEQSVTRNLRMEGMTNESGEEPGLNLNFMITSANYSEFINARMEEGRFFRTDEFNSVVVNREFVRYFGINPLGKDIETCFVASIWQTYHVVGIIEDVIPVGRGSKLKPCIYHHTNGLTNRCYVKLIPGAKSEVLEPLKAKMKEQVNTFAPEVETLEEDLASSTEEIQAMSYMLLLFASICIIICLLGIYSSMMLAVEKRGREMAIRKINGARLVDIARIFVMHYFVLLGIATLIAFPALYLGVQTWLENYTYRVPITLFPFIAIFVLLFAIVLLTIGSQLLKIMRVNPVEKLKSE